MFTGIIEKLGKVANQSNSRLIIETGFEDLSLGESVAVNGTCLTVDEITKEHAAAFTLGDETLKRTNLSDLKYGSVVNLERALKVNQRFSGHIVQGHVDGTGKFLSTKHNGLSRIMEFEFSNLLNRYCVEKGSVAINGISLTICALRKTDSIFLLSVDIIPFTWANTNLHCLKPNDRVNLEVDLIAKYVENMVAK